MPQPAPLPLIEVTEHLPCTKCEGWGWKQIGHLELDCPACDGSGLGVAALVTPPLCPTGGTRTPETGSF